MQIESSSALNDQKTMALSRQLYSRRQSSHKVYDMCALDIHCCARSAVLNTRRAPYFLLSFTSPKVMNTYVAPAGPR